MTAPLSTDEATALLTSILMDPQWSVDSIADLPKDDPFGKLCYDLAEIRAHVQALSKGEIAAKIVYPKADDREGKDQRNTGCMSLTRGKSFFLQQRNCQNTTAGTEKSIKQSDCDSKEE